MAISRNDETGESKALSRHHRHWRFCLQCERYVHEPKTELLGETL